MKKILSILLAVLMLASCLVVTVGAAETAPERLIVTKNDLATGWSGCFQLDAAIDGSDSCISYTATANVTGVGAFKAEFKAPQTYDISNMQCIAFDLYVSDAAVFNAAPLCIEISSAGTCDHQEIAVTSAAGGVMPGLKDGWNTVKINIGSLTSKTVGANADLAGDFDPTKWNYFRMFNAGELKVGAEGLTVAIDNFGFAAADPDAEGGSGEDVSALDAEEMTRTDTSVPLFGCNSAFGNFIIDKENKVAGSASLSYIMSAPTTARKVLSKAVDATGMDTLEMELYFSDLDIMNIDFGEATFEMSSSGVPDGAEKYIFFSDLFKAIKNPKVGWNHVAVPIDQMKNADVAKKGEFDISAINHIGIYWTKCVTDKIGMTFKVDNIRLTSGAAELEKAEAADIEAAVAAIQAVKGLKKADVNADNYAELKAKVEAAREAYDALSASGRTAADAQGCAVNLSSAERAILSYERELEREDEPTKPEAPAEPETPAVPDRPDEPETPNEPSEPDEPAEPDTSKGTTDSTMTLIIVIVAVTLVIVIGVAVACIVILKKRKS